MSAKTHLHFPDETRARAVASLKRYVSDELDVSMSDLKAGLLLDYITAELGPTLYNQAITTARGFIEERAADLDAACHKAEFTYWSRSR